MLLLLVVLAVAYAVTYSLDNWFLEPENGTGTVTAKEFTPAYTQMILIYNAALKASVPHFIPYPDHWELCIRVNGQAAWISVDESFYQRCNVGRTVHVTFLNGRFTKRLYLKDVQD
jgi:hypothetical protein